MKPGSLRAEVHHNGFYFSGLSFLLIFFLSLLLSTSCLTTASSFAWSSLYLWYTILRKLQQQLAMILLIVYHISIYWFYSSNFWFYCLIILFIQCISFSPSCLQMLRDLSFFVTVRVIWTGRKCRILCHCNEECWNFPRYWGISI